MKREPARVIAALTAAVNATVGVITMAGVWSAQVGGAVSLAVSAWVVAAGEIVRARVTPVNQLPPPPPVE